MPSLEFFTLTGHLTAVVVDYIDVGEDPDIQPISATAEFRARIPNGELIWATGLTPPTGVALAPVKARFDTDGYLRTIQNAAINESQTITITGAPTGGTFTLTYSGQTTTGIAYNADAPTVEAALAALSNIGVGNVNVGGNPGLWTATFTGTLAYTDVAQMTASGAGLTPSGGVTIATTATGGLNTGVKLVANTAVLGLDQLIYDFYPTNVVYNKDDQIMSAFGFEAPTVGGGTIDLAEVTRLPAKAQ